MKFLKSVIAQLFFAASIIFLTANVYFAQDKNNQQASVSEKKTATFKIPDGFLPAQMPKEYKGLSMLNPGKPAGIFAAYTPDNQKSDDFIVELRKMYGGFFVSDKNTVFEWKESALTIADNPANETAKMFIATTVDKELQFVAYTRTLTAGQDIVYGYFAMKDLKSKKNSADFIDAQGKGVKEFEKFRKTVGIAK